MPGRALFVCHAGEGLGLGHLSRSLVLAQAVQRELGWKCTLIVQGSAVSREGLDELLHQFIPLRSNVLDHCETWIRASSPKSPQAIFLDLHPRHIPQGLGQFLQQLGTSAGGHAANPTVRVAVDGLFDLHHALDVLWVPSFQLSGAAKDLSSNVAPSKLLYGWDCLLVNAPTRVSTWQAGHRVLVLTGGADATHLGRHWPAFLDAELLPQTELHWVKGPYAEAPVWPAGKRLAQLIEHAAPSSLSGLMQQVDYAVTVYGVTFFELLRAGIPTVVFSPYGVKDNPELQEIARLNLALVARDELHATHELNRLMNNESLAQSLSEAGMRRLGNAYPHRLIDALRAACRPFHTNEVHA